MLDELKANVRKTAVFTIGILVLVFCYLSYIQVVKSQALATNSLNKRAIQVAARIERGKIFDRNGQVLAFSERDSDGKYERHYPYGAMLAHVIGYSSTKYGITGIESSCNGDLAGMKNWGRYLGPIGNLWQPKTGNNVTLTIDATLEEIAYRALGNRRGAIVALNPKTGAVLAMVSKPGFNPENLERDWEQISSSPESKLLNRGVQGLYPPGSTLKVMIAESALAEKITDMKQTFTCEGAWKIGNDYELTEEHRHAHGKINLEEALAVSCNITFGKLTVDLGSKRLADSFSRYGFNRPVNMELEEVPVELPDFKHLSDGELAQTGIGQGGLLVTPLRMAMLAAAFANNGSIMKPYVVSKVTAPDGTIIEEFSGQEFLTPTSPALAKLVRQMMVAVVAEGTGSAAGIRGIKVAGKTGTAENPHGEPHAWFIGFAPADDAQIVVAVIIENAGAGGEEAAPVAGQIFAGALR
ncbi:MAG: pbpA [Firmicutes bacterium]|nr:pbpA [Bacillota bacterium]